MLLAAMMGCSSPPPASSPVESFELRSHSIQFSPPKDFSRAFAKDPEDPKGKKIAALIFDTASGQGHLGVNVIDEAKVTKIEKKTLEPFVDAIFKRNGKLTLQTEVDVNGEKQNGYRIEFEYGQGDTEFKGVQVHFPNKGALYSIVMTTPAKEFAQALPAYNAIVTSFKIDK